VPGAGPDAGEALAPGAYSSERLGEGPGDIGSTCAAGVPDEQDTRMTMPPAVLLNVTLATAAGPRVTSSAVNP